MTNNNPTNTGPYLQLFRKGSTGAPEGADKFETLEVPPHSRLICDAFGRFRAIPFWTAFTAFDLLPNLTSLAAAKDPMLVTVGTGTEIPARSAKGGINLKTQVTSPADNDNAILTTVAGTAMVVPMTAISRPRFSTRVKLSQITLQVFSAGLDENWTSPLPNGTNDDGAAFMHDPLNETTLVPTGKAANWILTEKVDGTDSAIDSGVPVVADKYYELEIEIGADLKPKYYIDGVLVGTGATALTSGASVAPVIGVQIHDQGTAAQHDFDCAYVMVERFLG